MNKEHCKFCKRFKKEVKIDKETGITVKNLFDTLKISIETLHNENCVIECWLNNDILLGNDFSIGHFNVIPDITFSFTNKEIEQLKSDLDIANKKLEEIKEYIENNSLYEEEYDYDYDENIQHTGTNDEIAKRDILSIIGEQQ
jgi:thioredoxin-related protein